jgi:hypothetical protein
MKSRLLALIACLLTSVHAQTPDEVPQAIEKERALLAEKRSAVLTDFEARSQACWQRFAVNDCISQARRIRRTEMQPLRQAELLLNEQERQWRTQQRNERVQNKLDESARQP